MQSERESGPRTRPPESVADATAPHDADVTTITATIPALLPEHLHDAPHYVVGYEAWVLAAEEAGSDLDTTITESTFDYTVVDPSADEDTTVAAINVHGQWHLLIREGTTVRAAAVDPPEPAPSDEAVPAGERDERAAEALIAATAEVLRTRAQHDPDLPYFEVLVEGPGIGAWLCSRCGADVMVKECPVHGDGTCGLTGSLDYFERWTRRPLASVQPVIGQCGRCRHDVRDAPCPDHARLSSTGLPLFT